MEYIRSQGSCAFVTVFFVLFCVDFAWRVEGDTIRLADIGDNITLYCYRPHYYNNILWYRDGDFFADMNGVSINNPRFTQGVTRNGNHDPNYLSISNLKKIDSATFRCYDIYKVEIQSFVLSVIRCSDCTKAAISDSEDIKVVCTLHNYRTTQVLYPSIILNGNIYQTAVIQGSAFSFSNTVAEINKLNSEFDLQIGDESRITCMLSTQPTPPSSSTTALPTTSLKRTTQNRPSTLSYTASKKLPIGRSTSISTTKHHSPTNKNASSDKNTKGVNITLIIVILGSVFILILIVIIIVLRCKKTKGRQDNKHTDNASIKKKHPEANYESVEDGSRKGPEYATSIKELRETSLDQRNADHLENGEMIDNILYASRDKIADSSISRVEGPLDDALYAMPDKRATISRESKSTPKVTDGSSNSDHLYGNSAIITQQELNSGGGLQQGDQYENVKMPGSGGDAEEIALYEMPDKGPTRNTLKATPEAGQTPTLPKDEVVSVDALYAEVDKTKKKYTNN